MKKYQKKLELRGYNKVKFSVAKCTLYITIVYLKSPKIIKNSRFKSKNKKNFFKYKNYWR